MDFEREITTVSEGTPLLRGFPEDDGGFNHQNAVFEFDPKGDPDNPREWSSGFKWAIVLLLACMAFTVYAHPHPFLISALPVPNAQHHEMRHMLNMSQNLYVHLRRPNRQPNRDGPRRRQPQLGGQRSPRDHLGARRGCRAPLHRAPLRGLRALPRHEHGQHPLCLRHCLCVGLHQHAAVRCVPRSDGPVCGG